MKTLIRLTSLPLLFFLAIGTVAEAQDLHPSRRPSPVGIAKTHVGDAYVKVTYGRPYVRGRAIFGADAADKEFLVPFGKRWRTGANEATEITLTVPMLVDGNRLEAGTYAIFTVPGPSSWDIHFSPTLGLDGTGRMNRATGEFTPNVYDAEQDVLVITRPSGALEEMVDQFTIVFEPVDAGAHMVLRWENTEVRVPLALAS